MCFHMVNQALQKHRVEKIHDGYHASLHPTNISRAVSYRLVLARGLTVVNLSDIFIPIVKVFCHESFHGRKLSRLETPEGKSLLD